MHCDKPCGEEMEPYRSVVEMCRAKNVPFQIGYMYRGNPEVKFIWDFVAKGGLGEVAFVEADMNHDYRVSAKSPSASRRIAMRRSCLSRGGEA